MRITIDNEDGLGPVDYTATVADEGPITLQRQLNTPSRCTAEIVLNLNGLATPARRGRVVVISENGTTLFTGYLATEPIPLFAGQGSDGPVYRAKLNAVSDEWVLDKQGSGSSATSDGLSLAVDGAGLVSQMARVAQGSTMSVPVTVNGSLRATGAFAVQPSAAWSTNAAAAAGASYASYRVVNGTITMQNAGAVVHALSDADGSLDLTALSTGHIRELANDITLSGAIEPAAYVQELFYGDGSTTAFELSESVFRGENRTLLRDSFRAAAFDTSQWTLSDPGSHLQLGSLGLTVNGGNGLQGQTTLVAVNAIEMSGFVLVELGGVVFGAGSDGMLGGFYTGNPVLEDCFAGFRVRQSTSTTGGVTVVVPVVNSAETGTVFTPVSGHRYTLRLRLYCVEMQRVPQRYYCMVDGAVQEFGSISGINAPMHVVFEVVDEGASSNTAATVLYDSGASGAPLAVTPATCSFAAFSSTSLFGSIASVEVTRPGSLWVLSTAQDGSVQTRLIGTAGQGVDCRVSYGTSAGAPGKVSFFSGRIPAAGERIEVTYRAQQRAVARVADASSISAETAAGAGVQVPGVSRWLGKVLAPEARSSVDCEAAAQAVLAMGTARSAALGGSYQMANPGQDIWPGDVLAVTSAGTTSSFLVRSVLVTDQHALPELMRYKIAFANDWATEWADGLGLKLSETIAKDAVLPVTAESGATQVLDNLQQMDVVSLTSLAVQVDAGCAPPSGGGFEVRRRDWEFGVGVDTPDLVLRSPVRSFSIPRSAQAEQFYVRMYDGSTPPVYSRFSSALIMNWPVD